MLESTFYFSVKAGDVIEAFKIVEVKRKLGAAVAAAR